MSKVPPNVKGKVDEILASESPVLVKVQSLVDHLTECGLAYKMMVKTIYSIYSGNWANRSREMSYRIQATS